MKAVLDTNFHLDGIVTVWRHAERMDPDVLLLHHIRHAPRDSNPHKVPADRVRINESQIPRSIEKTSRTIYSPQFDIDSLVALELLLHVLEVEVERLRLTHLPWGCEFLREG